MKAARIILELVGAFAILYWLGILDPVLDVFATAFTNIRGNTP